MCKSIEQFGVSQNDHYGTPMVLWDWIVKESRVAREDIYDPCPAVTDAMCGADGKFIDGLTTDWHKFNYCNPPWTARNIALWIDKAYGQKLLGRTTWMLVPLNVDRKWFTSRVNEQIWDDMKFYTGSRLKFLAQLTGLPMLSMFTNVCILVFDGESRIESATPVHEVMEDFPEPLVLTRSNSGDFITQHLPEEKLTRVLSNLGEVGVRDYTDGRGGTAWYSTKAGGVLTPEHWK